MNITFLIGNGFDLNLGLKTSYSDFIAEYMKKGSSSEVINKMHKHMTTNIELWADAELALGKFTEQFKLGEGKDFIECYKNFCKQLAEYLKAQEERIDYNASEDKISKAFTQLKNLTNCFPTQEKAVIDKVYRNHSSEEIKFQFISFNYTYTLDKCLEIVKTKHVDIGHHQYGNRVIKNSIESICHVHGTVDQRMIFAVNDESQIPNISVFDCENGNIYKNSIIKKLANESFRENTDAVAKNILDRSQIIYIYGMSVGLTDKLWWTRICNWLRANRDRHLIIQRYNAPLKGVLQIDYQIFENEQRNKFLSFCELEHNKISELENRIHITGENIFEAISGIV